MAFAKSDQKLTAEIETGFSSAETPLGEAHSNSDTDEQYRQNETEEPAAPPWRALFFSTTRSHIPLLTIAIILSLAEGLVDPALAYFSGRFLGGFTSLASGEIDREEFMRRERRYVSYIAIIAAAEWVLSSVEFFLWLTFGELQAKSARDRLFHGLLEKNIEWYDMRKHGIGSMLPRLQAQIRELQLACSQPSGQLFTQASTSILSLIQAFVISWDLTLVTMATVPLFTAALIWAGNGVQRNIAGQQEKLTEAQKYSTNCLSSIETVKCFNGQDVERAKYSAKINEAAAWYYRVASANALQMGLLALLAMSMFVQGFYYGGLLINQGKLEPADVVTAFIAAVNGFQGINGILPQLPVLEKGRTAGAVLRKVMTEVQQGTKVKESPGSYAPGKCRGNIEVEHVSFSYPSRPDQLAVDDISLSIPGGDFAFIIGKSGSGKSTIGQLLMGFYRSSQGCITVDGVPLDQLDPKWLRSNITLVEQTSVLFNDTLFHNIALARKDYNKVTRTEAIEAAEFALLQHMINDMPHGMDTRVGYKGGTLSGGQRQRMALARARLRDTPILLLDESTSALDRISRALMMDAIRHWRQGKTTIVITHDIAQILPDDYVFVLDHAKLVQEGYRRDLDTMSDTPFQMFVPARGEALDVVSTAGKSTDVASIRTRGSSIALGTEHAGPDQDLIEKELAAGETEKRRSFLPRVLESGTPFLPSWTKHPGGMSSSMMHPSARQALHVPGQEMLDTSAARWSGFWPIKEGRAPARSLGSRGRVSSMEKFVHKTGELAVQSRHTPSGVVRTRARRDREESDAGNQEIRSPSDFDEETNVDAELQAAPLRSLKQILATVWPTLDWRAKAACFLGFYGASGHAVGAPAFSFVLSRLISLYGVNGDTRRMQLVYSMIILCLAFLDAIHVYMFRFFLEYVGQRWVDQLRADAIQRVLDQPRAFFDREENSVARITLNLDRNAEETRNIVGRFIGFIWVACVMSTVAIIWAMSAQWKMVLISLCTGPYILGTTKAFAAVSSKWEGRSNEAAEDATAIFNETFTNIKTVRALTLERFFLTKYIIATNHALRVGFRRSAYTGFFCGAANSSANFGISLVFFVGAWLVYNGAVVVDVIQVITMLLFSILQLSAILNYIPQISASQDTATRLLRLAQLPRTSHEHSGNTHIPYIGDIVFSDLRFAYPSRPNHTVLSSLDLHLPAGSFTAIVGGSGSGKSTITNLLTNLYATTPTTTTSTSPPSLTISGLPINQIHTPSLRTLIAPVPQTPTLFPATIHTNITYGLPATSPYTTPAAVTAAARAAGLHDFISSLPAGYATAIGDGGVGLSGGQAQRVAIARALVRRPAVLVLDEATSALDVESARLVREGVERARGQRGKELTVVVITHAREMMEVAERVVVVERGRVVQVGGFAELVRRRGPLRDLLGGGVWVGEGEGEGDDGVEGGRGEGEGEMVAVERVEAVDWKGGMGEKI